MSEATITMLGWPILPLQNEWDLNVTMTILTLVSSSSLFFAKRTCSKPCREWASSSMTFLCCWTSQDSLKDFKTDEITIWFDLKNKLNIFGVLCLIKEHVKLIPVFPFSILNYSTSFTDISSISENTSLIF